MNKLIIPLFCLALALGSCSSNSSNGITESELAIRNSVGSQTIATAAARGAITLNVGQQRSVDIIRTVRGGAVSPLTTDETANVDANFSEPTVASMDVNGTLTGLVVGFTEMEVVFRDGDGDPSDDDKVYLDITVIPAV